MFRQLTFLLVPICGISFKNFESYSVISLWLQPPMDPTCSDNSIALNEVMDLVEFIKECMSESFQSIINSVVLMNNRTFATTKIFESN